jgi:hypothetical protein
MTSLRKYSLAAGIFYLLTFVSIPTLVLYKSVRGPSFVAGPGPDTPVLVGVLLEMIVALANIGTAAALYPVVRRQGEARAVGFVASRVLEAATMYVGIVSLMSIVTLRQAGLGAAALATGQGLAAQYHWTFFFAQSFIPAINGVLLGSLLYQSPGASLASCARTHRIGPARRGVVRGVWRIDWRDKPGRGGRDIANRRMGIFARRLPDRVGLQTLPDHGRYVTHRGNYPLAMSLTDCRFAIMSIARALPIAVAALSMGCHSSLGPTARVVGIIDVGQTSQEVIAAPAEASLGRSFSVTISTFGDSCVRAAGADVTIDGLVATITPYDMIVSTGTCLDYLKAYPRAVELKFTQAGAATIRVKGRSDYQPGLVTVERSLVVTQ